jgi:osmotically-inducible protein OsmY
MVRNQPILKEIRAAFEHEPRINMHKYPIHMTFEEGLLTLEGEVDHVAAKKLAMELAVAVRGVTGIVDRLHVTPSVRMGDGAILDAVRDALLQEPCLRTCTIQVKHKGMWETVREVTANPHGVIQVSVTDGVVLLDDHVTSLTQKRQAGLLAWWVPGSRDVINGMEVVPPQKDSDEDLVDSVRLALKRIHSSMAIASVSVPKRRWSRWRAICLPLTRGPWRKVMPGTCSAWTRSSIASR